MVSHAKGERSYHVLYYLCAGATPQMKQTLRLHDTGQFRYGTGPPSAHAPCRMTRGKRTAGCAVGPVADVGRSWADVGRYACADVDVGLDAGVGASVGEGVGGVDDATMFVRLLEAFRTCNIEGTAP